MNRFFISDWRTHKSFIIRQLILFTLFMAFIPGCASKGGKVLSEQTLQTRDLEPSPGNALVYFYYEKLSLKSTKVELNGAASEIEKDTYVLWEVSPGKYQLTFTFGSGILSEVVTSQITCEAKQIYYFRMAGTDRETHNIQQVDPQKGQSKIEGFNVIGWFKDGVQVPQNISPN